MTDDYFQAINKVEQSLQDAYEVVKVQSETNLLQLIQQLEKAEMELDERLEIACLIKSILRAGYLANTD